jgi:tryptophan-rich sensory protein
MASGQQMGRETFGLIIMILGLLTVIATALTMYFFVEDAGLILFIPVLFSAFAAVLGMLIIKGVILKHMRSNEEIAAKRDKRR